VRRQADAIDDQLRELVLHMARGIVDNPDAVEVEIVETGEETLLELHCAESDRPHVIGKQGRTARALRLALSAAAGKHGRDADLDITD
jgi:predicted RNA-binding protein YlqC (UPF0109 family)